MGVTRGALPFVAFTQVRNAWLRDERVSYKAKGLLGYLCSHAEGYRLSQAQIVRQGTDGRDSVVSGLAELERAGYLVRNRERRASGGRFAEDEFTLADPFDAEGKLLPVEPREIRIPYEDEPRETHQGGKSASGDPHRETRPVEEQGENNTPAPTEQGATGDRHLRAVDADHEAAEHIASTAQAVAAEHYEATGKLGGSRAFLATRGIIAGALKAGHAPEQIRPALAHLRARGRPVTNSTLGPLLADPRLAQTVTRSGYGPAYREDDLPDDAHRGAF